MNFFKKFALNNESSSKSVDNTNKNSNKGQTWLEILNNKKNRSSKKRKLNFENFETLMSSNIDSNNNKNDNCLFVEPDIEYSFDQGSTFSLEAQQPKKKSKTISIINNDEFFYENDTIEHNGNSISRKLPDSFFKEEKKPKTKTVSTRRSKKYCNPELDEKFLTCPLIANNRAYNIQKERDIQLIAEYVKLNTSVIKSELKLHQKEAFQWAMEKEYLHCLNPEKYEGFGLLADEMGLGKTLVMLSLIASHRKMSHKKEDIQCTLPTTLYICPTILLDEMGREIDKHCHDYSKLKYKIIQGPSEMARLKKIYSKDFIDECYDYDILLTNFETARSLYKLLRQMKFLRIIIDEAHYIRNQKTSSYKNIRLLRAKYYWCLTGSPISNNMNDLHSLLCIMRSKIFSDSYIWKNYIEGDPERCKKYISIMSNEYIMRRQQDILNLPDYTINYEYVEFTDLERCIYDYIWNKTKQELTKKELEILESDDIFLKLNLNILEKLLRVRQCCDNYRLMKLKKSDIKLRQELRNFRNRNRISNESFDQMQSVQSITSHLSQQNNYEDKSFTSQNTNTQASLKKSGNLIDIVEDSLGIEKYKNINQYSPNSSSTSILKEDQEDYQNIFDEVEVLDSGYIYRPAENVYDLTTTEKKENDKMMNQIFDLNRCNSSKINAVVAKVKKCIDESFDSNRKIVIFCQWTEIMDMIGQKIERELNLQTLKIEGSMSREERSLILEQFNLIPNKHVLIASINCCSHGLNLQIADIGIIVEPWYNPQIENQAICRLVRFGQRKNVQIYRFIVRGTLEERIKNTQERKMLEAESIYTID